MRLSQSDPREFRDDINALRAWALLAVLIFHFDFPWLRGGFIGVDVFFVISGFLMTRIIVGALERSSAAAPFSLAEFILARAQRIVPALSVLCGLLLVAGWFFLPSAEYSTLARHVATSLGFASNFQYWNEVAYFDQSAHEKWLLHTWSLSCEWQFYMLFPIFQALVWRRWPTRQALGIACAVAAAASLTVAISWAPGAPAASFYLLPARAWEMLAGAGVFLCPLRPGTALALRRAMQWSGLAVLSGACVWLKPGMTWPGWHALVPVAGACLVMAAGRSAPRWSALPGIQWFGRISYSVYLWHWPILLAFEYLNRRADPATSILALGLSLLLGHMSWRWVEQPLRRVPSQVGQGNGVLPFGVLWLSVIVAGTLIYFGHGMPARLDRRIELMAAAANDSNARRKECHVSPPAAVPECAYGGGALGAIVIGDSHAASVIRSIERAMARPDQYVLDWTYSACPTLAGAERIDTPGCSRFLALALERQRGLDTVPVIIVNRTASALFGPNDDGREAEFDKPRIYFDQRSDAVTPTFLVQARQSLITTACAFARYHPTFLVRPIPELHANVPRTMAHALLMGRERHISISLDEYRLRQQFIWEAQDAARLQCGVRILDPLPYLCRAGRCWGDRDGRPLYMDAHHLNEYGAAQLTPMFQAVFR